MMTLRYFPEPDLPPLELADAELESARAALPELPAARRVRYAAMGLPLETVLTLTDEAATGTFFDATLAAGAAPKAVSNYLVGDVMAYCKDAKVRCLADGRLPRVEQCCCMTDRGTHAS